MYGEPWGHNGAPGCASDYFNKQRFVVMKDVFGPVEAARIEAYKDAAVRAAVEAERCDRPLLIALLHAARALGNAGIAYDGAEMPPHVARFIATVYACRIINTEVP